MFKLECARCGAVDNKKEKPFEKTVTFICSFFNTDMICNECKTIETKHPDYKRAVEVELEEVKKGNYNYEGIGLPADFEEFVKAYKESNK